MTGKKWYRLGVGLCVLAVSLGVVGVVFAYRFATDKPIPAFLEAPIEEAAASRWFAGALILLGPALIMGALGYSLMEKFGDHEWDDR